MAGKKAKGKAEPEQAQADTDSPQVPAGTQVSDATGPGRVVQDVEGKPIPPEEQHKPL